MAEGDTNAEFDPFTLRRSGRIVNQASETDEQDVGETPATINRKPRGKWNKGRVESLSHYFKEYTLCCSTGSPSFSLT